jgi:preprotein translocase subunit SecA
MAGRGVDIKLGGPKATPAEAEVVKNLGGLFVLGTERHEARRIDNQLRGRAGRQGDMGETQFFVSLEDDLMRIFGSEKIKSMMGRFGIPEDEPIDSRLVSKSIEGAQEKIEGFHFDSRKHVLEYDDVLGFQRSIIYGRRRKLLTGTDEEVEIYLAELTAGTPELEEIIKKKREELGASFVTATRQLLLQIIDMLWLEHLEAMDYLRSSVRLRAYGQRDPLLEYKREGLSMFKELEATLIGNVIHLMPALGQVKTDREQQNLREIKEGADNITNKASGSLGGLVNKPEVGRNDPCPCGSGLKYKKCGMIGAHEHEG